MLCVMVGELQMGLGRRPLEIQMDSIKYSQSLTKTQRLTSWFLNLAAH